MPGDVAVFAFIRRGDGPFHDADEAFGSGNGLFQSRFGGFARGGHDGFMVIERNRIQNQLINERLPCPQQGLRTARALGVVQIHHGRAAGHGQRPRDLFGESGPHAHRHGDHATEFQEISAGYSLPFQPSLDILFSQTNGNTHTLLLIQRPARCRSHAWIKMVGTPPASPRRFLRKDDETGPMSPCLRKKRRTLQSAASGPCPKASIFPLGENNAALLHFGTAQYKGIRTLRQR